MKISTLVISFTLLFSTFSFSQQDLFEYGISTFPSLTFAWELPKEPSVSFSGGVFCNYNISDRFGIGGSLEYKQLNLKQKQFSDRTSRNLFEIIKTPVWMSINLNPKSTGKSKSYLIIGYSFGKILFSDAAEREYNLTDLVDRVHFGKIGLESRIRLGDEHQFTIGQHLDFTNIYDRRYGNIFDYQIVIRIGKITFNK
ncbi:MAG: hypothetical protein AB8F94_30210 [Saprospiraceae bacterium]